ADAGRGGRRGGAIAEVVAHGTGSGGGLAQGVRRHRPDRARWVRLPRREPHAGRGQRRPRAGEGRRPPGHERPRPPLPARVRPRPHGGVDG
ncbi:unnamed protein product, partial [Ectocarpus fasciculatus]